ncbi:MAG: alpha/beta hydrolase-fold protein [Balneola sp.]
MNQIVLKFILPFLFLLVVSIGCTNNSNQRTLTISDLEEKFIEISSIQSETQRKSETDSLWSRLIKEGQIPFKQDSVAIFLFKGEADQVSWNGDFNSWSGDKSFDNAGTKVEGTNIWMLNTTFPPDARIDYKVTIDESWILDPVNPHYQLSGFGPNSELRMPDWKSEPFLERIPEAPKGSLTDNILIKSSHLDYEVQYQIYTPVGYENLNNLPVIYILDGQEYSDEKLGASVIMLDNLIHLKKIKPVVAVFVDPRDPENPDSNRRSEEFGTNEYYNDFFTKELMPRIESEYKISTKKKDTALLGTSLGGLNTTYLGFMNPEVFGKLAIQAPAYWYKEKEIFELVRNTEKAEFDIFMSVGTINDNIPDTRLMKQEFERLDLDMKYTEVNEGHSWGAWSAQMDNILIQFFKK